MKEISRVFWRNFAWAFGVGFIVGFVFLHYGHCAESASPVGRWRIKFGDITLHLNVNENCAQETPCQNLTASDQNGRVYQGWYHAGRTTLTMNATDYGWTCVLLWDHHDPTKFAWVYFCSPDPWMWTLDTRLVACKVRRKE